MDREELANVLNTFANWPSAFTIEEIRTYLDSEIGDEILCNEFAKDKRFIFLLESNTPKKQYFLSQSTLFQWLCNFNLRLAKIKKFKLNERQLSTAISSLRRNGRWDIPPAKVIQWGHRYGFICNAWTDGCYVFPLAQALSFLHPSSLSIVVGVFKDFYEKQIWKISLTKLRKETMQSGFSQFPPKISYVIQAREGFQTGVKMTLEQVGKDFMLTRERIRQIEEKFWNTLNVAHLKLKQKPFTWDFIAAWLADFMAEQGSLVVSTDDPKLHLRKFLSQCAGIPSIKLNRLKLVLIAVLPKHVSFLESHKWETKEIDANALALRLENYFSFMESDVKFISDQTAHFRRKHLTQIKTVYLALRKIGQPAHYSKVAEVHNFLFPEKAASERNIQATLGREQHGVVWVGVAGTFALEEWGYEHPSQGLYETVTEIVQKKYNQTGKPVSFTVITAEINKYRKIVNSASIVFASHFNPSLQEVSKDFFIPKDSTEAAKQETSFEDKLDKILEQFSNSD